MLHIINSTPLLFKQYYNDISGKDQVYKPVFTNRYTDSIDTFLSKRNKSLVREISNQDKLKAIIGSTAGTVFALSMMMKKQKVRNPFKLKYDLKDMILASTASIFSGVAVGMICEKKQAKINKFKEGVFQTLNASIPPWVVAGGIKLCEDSKNFNNIPGKIMAVVAGLLVGMYGAASISNIFIDPHDKTPDRKLNLQDCIANIDDALGVLVLAKFPIIGKLHLESFLPIIYTYCGYRAGKSN